MSTEKSCLIINRTAPYGSSHARDALDVALTSGVFEMPLTLLFSGDGVWQLRKEQQPDTIEQKSFAANLCVLPMYDIDRILVCSDAMAQRGLSLDELVLPAESVDAERIRTEIQQHDLVLTF